MNQAIDVIEEYLDSTDSHQLVAKLRDAGWILVRHDAIKLAQAHARDELRADNDNRECEEGSHGRCTPCEQIGTHYCPRQVRRAAGPGTGPY